MRKLVVGDDFGDRDTYYFWDDHPDITVNHRGRWQRHMVRTDAQGRNWSCAAGEFVMDDFGFLVEVAS